MGFVTDRNLLHYPDRIFTLFQEVGNIVEIACPCSIFTMSANLFYKTDVDKSFNCRVNCFPIHTTFFCYKPPGRKTGTGIIVAVPEQTAIYDKVPRLQPELKDSVGYHKKNFLFLMQSSGTISFVHKYMWGGSRRKHQTKTKKWNLCSVIAPSIYKDTWKRFVNQIWKKMQKIQEPMFP